MREKVFLRRQVFLVLSLVGVALNSALALYVLVIPREQRLYLRVGHCVYSVIFSLLVYYCSVHKVSMDNLLYAIYLYLGNSLALFVGVLCSFLQKFGHKSPQAVLLRNMLTVVVILFSLGMGMFTIVVRKFILLGMVKPISVQRAKGLESAIVLIRREYPEIFS